MILKKYHINIIMYGLNVALSIRLMKQAQQKQEKAKAKIGETSPKSKTKF